VFDGMRQIVKQCAIALALLFIGELIAFAMLSDDGVAFNFLLQPQGLKEDTEGFQSVGYDEIDPLLGWSMSSSKLAELGYAEINGVPVLNVGNGCTTDTIRILITGGSTSDLAFQRENWPIHLARMLADSGICARVFVGAIGGYSSGQELLKLLRDGLRIEPHIHISYSGANEPYGPSFVSQYEMKVFNRVMETRSTILLPNLVYLLRLKLGMISGLKLHLANPEDVAFFWINNMRTMHAIAEERGYIFFGVLQPVLGVGRVDQPTELQEWADLIADYRKFYPMAIAHCQRTSYLEDLTPIFDLYEAPVYVDDCHLRPEMQPIVAAQLMQVIREKLQLEQPTEAL